MEALLPIILSGIDVFLLVFVRLAGLFIITPVFGTRTIPAYLKIGFAFFLSLIMINTLDSVDLNYSGFVEYGFIIIKEFLIGLALGFLAYLMVNCIYMAGELIDMQIGFGMVNVVSPLSNNQVPITANFYYIVSVLVLLSVKGHYIIIKALCDSYENIPINGIIPMDNLVENIIRLFGNFFILGFKIAAPITATILITDIMLGVLAKAVPQLNIFVLGLPLKIGLGIIVMIITLPMFVSVLEGIFLSIEGEMNNFLR